MEAYGETNFLKAGILHANRVNAVSETYAREIQGQQGGEGLDGVMREISGKLSGIVNGIDVAEYDPKTDPRLKANFDVKTIARKKQNKAAGCTGASEGQLRNGNRHSVQTDPAERI